MPPQTSSVLEEPAQELQQAGEHCRLDVQEQNPVKGYMLLQTACGMKDLFFRSDRHPLKCSNCKKPFELSEEGLLHGLMPATA